MKEIDVDVKNKFRWSWLEKSVTVRVKIGKNTEDVIEKFDYIAKTDVPEKAQCLYCDDTINYGSHGCVALVEHASEKEMSNMTRLMAIYAEISKLLLHMQKKRSNRSNRKKKHLHVRLQQERVHSRAQQKRCQEQAAKVARLAHQKAQKSKATERLMHLAAKHKKTV